MKLVYANALPIRLYGPNEKTGGVIAAAAIGAAGTLGAAYMSSQAAGDNQQIANNLQYQPIDINALQSTAQQTAASNAANSIALEQQNEPGLSAARFGLQNTVASQLAQGGNLSPDVYNQTANAAISGANSAGLTGAGGPITAASIGQTSQALLQQRIQNAGNLVNANALPVAGLDPGQIASALVGQNNAENQFALSKAGYQTNANQSSADAWGSAAGAIGGVAQGALDKYKASKKPPPTADGNTPTFSNSPMNLPTTVNYGSGGGFASAANAGTDSLNLPTTVTY